MTTLFQKKPFIIGMVHLGDLRRVRSAEERDTLFTHAFLDTRTLVEGGVDGIMFENMYDVPHTERLDDARKELFTELVVACVKNLSIPFGLSILWNDYRSGFQLAKTLGASWIRVPVFVDGVKTVYGVFEAHPEAVLQARTACGAEDVLILADIQVKHAEMLAPRPIAASAQAAEAAGADGVIVTGTWTGEPAALVDVQDTAKVTTLPIFIGSGIAPENLLSYMPFINGVIVGTALKNVDTRPKEEERLRTPEDSRIDVGRVRQLVEAASHAKSVLESVYGAIGL